MIYLLILAGTFMAGFLLSNLPSIAFLKYRLNHQDLQLITFGAFLIALVANLTWYGKDLQAKWNKRGKLRFGSNASLKSILKLVGV